MKNLFFSIAFLYSSFLMAQIMPTGVITPPEKVVNTFQKEYPGKVPEWTIKYVGDDDDEIRYEAKFKTNPTSEALAVYDNLGVLKAFESQIALSKLPPKA